MAIKGARPDERRICAHLLVRDADAATEFYRQAFGAEPLYRTAMPDGRGGHAQLRIGDSVLLLTTAPPAEPAADAAPPRATTILQMCVDDVDATVQRAVAAGATLALPVEDRFFGDRYGQIIDPFGTLWGLATVQEGLPPEEVDARMQAQYAGE
jgi:PhnB protein